ncbi:MAG TPA: hypothetical protein VF081_01175 [Solirubrobacterales bacterium]
MRVAGHLGDMDLFECPTCSSRFVVSEAGDGEGWRCPGAGHELRLVARSLPGTADQIEAALGARQLALAGERPTLPACR